jgi:hypothetical protein
MLDLKIYPYDRFPEQVMKKLLYPIIVFLILCAIGACGEELARPVPSVSLTDNAVVQHIAAHLKQYLILLGAVIVLLIILSIYRKHKQHEDGIVEYNDTLRAALGQTQVTPKELDKLRGIQTFYHLSDREVKQIHIAQFEEVFANTPPETFIVGQGLAKIEGARKSLELSDAEVADILAEVDRIKRRSEISKGNLPEAASPISLKEGETCHFVAQAELLEGDLPESEGIRFEFGRRAVYYRDGELLPIPGKGLASRDRGKLVLTSQRIAFTGRSPFQYEYGKLKGVVVFHDALGVYPDAPERWFRIEDPETCAVIASKAAQEHLAL